MVSLNPQNVLHLIQNLTTDYWIGFRKNLNGSDPWSRWSNGEPMSFQNWYPGRPVLSKPMVPVVYEIHNHKTIYNSTNYPTCDCCCKNEGTAYPTTSNNTFEFENTSDFSTLPPTITSTTELTTIPTTIPMTTLVSEPVTNGTTTDDEVVYLEDPCVSIASSGLWFEKNCSERLSYICFEERFYGKAEVTNITLHDATLTWLAGPGDISHYRVNVRGEQNRTFNQSELTYYFTNLTPGALYTVQVFPIKCERDLNPQNTSFYTQPDVVNYLNVANVAETAVLLSWNPPSGKSDLYQVRVGEMNLSTKTTFKEVGNLTPGGFYTFEVNVEVNNSKQGDRVNISVYTKPSTVFNLEAIKPTFESLLLNWTHPAGNYSRYRICWSWKNDDQNCSTTSGDKTTFNVENLPAGTSVNMSVVVLVEGSTLEGDSVNVTGFTAPGPVSNITMLTDTNSINTSWVSPKGNFGTFCFSLNFAGRGMNVGADLCRYNTTDNYYFEDNKQSSVNYSFSIQTKNGNLKSEWMYMTNFTLPKPPRNVKVIFKNDTSANITWDPPEDTIEAPVTYKVKYFAEFWKENGMVDNLKSNSHMFFNLRPGTSYTFSVLTVSGDHQSNPVTTTEITDPNLSFLYLDMECSAATVANCNAAYKEIVRQLKKHIEKTFNQQVFWELNERHER